MSNQIGLLLVVAAIVMPVAGCGAGRATHLVRGSSSAAGGNASDGWSAPQTASSGDVEVPDVAVGARGDAVAVWVTVVPTNGRPRYAIRTALFHPTGGWRLSKALSANGQSPVVAAGARGAIVAWQDGLAPFPVRVDRLDFGMGWAPTRVLSSGIGLHPDAAISSRGKEIVVWSELSRSRGSARTMRVSIARIGSDLGRPRQLSGPGRAYDPAVAIDGRGDAVVVWEDQGAGPCRIYASFAPAGRSWGKPQPISARDVGCVDAPPALAIDANGTTLFAWLSTLGRTSYVRVAELSVSGHLRSLRTLAYGSEVTPPQIAENARGDALVVWSALTRLVNGDYAITAGIRMHRGSWQVGQVTGARGLMATAAIDARGDALVAWVDRGIKAAWRGAGSGWRVPQTIWNDPDGSPIIGLTARGDALVAWQAKHALMTSFHSAFTP